MAPPGADNSHPQRKVRFALAPDVHTVQQEGGARLFDFGRGRFYAVDSTGACILGRLLALPFPQAIATVAADYGVSEERVRDDALSLAATLTKRRLLIDREGSAIAEQGSLYRHGDSLPGESPSAYKRSFLTAAKGLWRVGLRFLSGRFFVWAWCFPAQRITNRIQKNLQAAARQFSVDAPRPTTPRTMRRLLRLAWASYRLLGWQESIHRWRQLSQPATAAVRKADEVMPVLDELIRQAASRVFLTPLACKERALVGWSLLRSCYGLPAELVIGFEPYPFGLHAWVECDGAVLTDDKARCESYQQIVRYA